ncbi:MAG: hypothetical protein RIE24_17165 [Silicimonas sp.]
MLKRLLFILALSLAPAPAIADATSVRDRIVTLLREDGYTEIRMSRTLLGRLRFVGKRRDAEREIVINPNTGVILRDYIRFLKNGRDGDGDDDDDDDDDDDEDDDDEDNSGSGSSNSGSGSDDEDDDESDNSGSGSSSSGSGSGDDDED